MSRVPPNLHTSGEGAITADELLASVKVKRSGGAMQQEEPSEVLHERRIMMMREAQRAGGGLSVYPLILSNGVRDRLLLHRNTQF